MSDRRGNGALQGRQSQRLSRRPFVCSWPDCRRSFNKSEHLQRHERSHAGDSRYECPLCLKRFVRRDVMTRHAALHGDIAAVVKKPRKVSCVSCVASKVRCDGSPGSPCSRCSNSGRSCTYRGIDNIASNSNAVVHGSAAGAASSETPDIERNYSALGRQISGSDVNVPESPLVPAYPLLGDSIASDISTSAAVGFETLPLDPLYDLSIGFSENPLGWDIGEDDFDLMGTLNDAAQESPPACWPLSSLGLNSTPCQIPEAEQGTTAASTAQLIRDAQPADSPWPHVYRPSHDDSRLDLPQPTTTSVKQPNLPEAYLDHVDAHTRKAILALVNASHQPQWPVVEVSAFPSTRTLSVFINLYFRHFHDALPILRRSAFCTAETSPVLLLSMAAIGAIYSRNGSIKLAVALNELARRAIAYLRESDRRAMFDTSIVQAWLLQSVFALFCGSPMLYQHAEINRGGLVTAARRMHLLRPNLSFVEELERRQTTLAPEELHQAYAKDEERRRLGWGIYLYDMQIACLLNIPSHFSIGEIDMPLPSEEDSWNARASADFKIELAKANRPNFRCVIENLLSVGKLPMPLNPFGLSLVAHTLYREILYRCIHLRFNPPEPLPARWFFLPAPFPIEFQTELLDQLSACFHFLSYVPNSLLVSVSALSHLGHIQFTWPGFLDKVKIAAGKSGTEESKRESRSWLSTKIMEDPISTRSILVHAGQLNALLMRFTFDIPLEAVWTFYAALSFWSILKFGMGLNMSVSGPKKTVITWSDLDDVDGWIQNGGMASFQGLGNLAELSHSTILSIFSERLESMSWGISHKFRQVLMDLSNEQ